MRVPIEVVVIIPMRVFRVVAETLRFLKNSHLSHVVFGWSAGVFSWIPFLCWVVRLLVVSWYDDYYDS